MEFQKLSVAKLKHFGKMLMMLPIAALALTATSCDDDKDSPTPAVPETVNIQLIEATPDCYYFIPYLQQHGNYYIELATGPIGYSGINAYPMNEGDYILAMDLYSWADADHHNPKIPAGLYTATEDPDLEHDLTYSLSNTMLVYNAGKNEEGLSIVRFTRFTEGIIDIRTGDDGSYTVHATMTGEDGKDYDLTFSGAIKVEDMSAIEDEDWWGFSGNTEYTAKKANYVYYDDMEEVDNYYLRLYESDKVTGDYNHPNDQSSKLCLCLFTEPGKGLAGNYTVNDTQKAGTCMTGARFGASAVDSYVEKIVTDWTARYALINEGNITITENNGIYTVNVDCKTPEGASVKVTYTGEIENVTGKAPSYSTLEKDITVTPTQCSQVQYYGNFEGSGTYPYSIALANETELLFFDFVAATGSMTEIPTGTYTIDGDYDAGSLVAGSVDGNYLLPTCYTQYNEDATEVVASAPVAAGTLTVTRSGDKYTFTFDLVDDGQPTHTIKGSCTVTLPEFEDLSDQYEAYHKKGIKVPSLKKNAITARIVRK